MVYWGNEQKIMDELFVLVEGTDSFKKLKQEDVEPVAVPSFYMAKYVVRIRDYMEYVWSLIEQDRFDENETVIPYIKETLDEVDFEPPKKFSDLSEKEVKDLKADLSRIYLLPHIDPDYPITNIGFEDAQKYIAALNEACGVKEGEEFALPTDTQWEYAARGGKYSKGYKFAGSDNIDEVGWYAGNSGNPPEIQTVGKLKPNELGLYDMSGLVWEWTCTPA